MKTIDHKETNDCETATSCPSNRLPLVMETWRKHCNLAFIFKVVNLYYIFVNCITFVQRPICVNNFMRNCGI